MTNYWIVLVLFSCLGLLFDAGKGMPGDWPRFLKSIVLLHSYNGAWWYINTYILVLLIPPALLLAPVSDFRTAVQRYGACFVVSHRQI